MKREVDVEQLTRGRREHGLVEDLVQALAQLASDAAAVEQPERVEECEVARDDRDRQASVFGGGNRDAGGLGQIAVAAGDIRAPAADEVAVDHVIVHDERRMQQLEGGADVGGGLGIGAAQRLVRREHHRRTEAFAPGRVVLERLPEGHVARADGRGARLCEPEEAVENGIDVLSPPLRHHRQIMRIHRSRLTYETV
jgi:hypothetical protein